MADGGFERGLTTDWTTYLGPSAQKRGAVYVTGAAHCGSMAVRLGTISPSIQPPQPDPGGARNTISPGWRISEIAQALDIPSDIPGASLDLWVQLESVVDVRDGDAIAAWVYDWTTHTDTWIGGVSSSGLQNGGWVHLGPFDLRTFIGKRVLLEVEAWTTALAEHGAIFRVDDIHVFTAAGHAPDICF